MNSYPVVPTSAPDAAANAARSRGRAVPLLFVSIFVGLIAVVAAFFLVDDPSATPAWIVVAIAGTISIVAAVLTRSVRASGRYAVAVRWSALRLVGMLVGFGGVMAAIITAIEAAGLEESAVAGVLKPLLIFGLVGVVGLHQFTSARLIVDNQGIRLRRSAVPWAAVESIVLARDPKAQTVEIGIRPRPGTTVEAVAVRRGETLGDLPARVVLELDRFDLAGVLWGVNQSGRTDIAVVERTPVGEHLVYRSNTPAPEGVGRRG